MKETLELEVISDHVSRENIAQGQALYYALTDSPLDYQHLGEVMESRDSWVKIDTFLFDESIPHSQVGAGVTIFIANNKKSSLPLAKAKITKRYFRRVIRDDWRDNHFLSSDNEELIDLEMIISDEQKTFFEYGMYPQSMDEKWFLFCEDDTFHFVHSWGSVEICKGDFVKIDEDQWKITAIKVEKNDEQDKAETTAYVKRLIESYLSYSRRIMELQ